jgi:hypothetical protein
MKYRNKKLKIELDEFTQGGFSTLDWLDEDKMDDMIYGNLKKNKKKLKKSEISS